MAYTTKEKFILTATILASAMVFIDGTTVNIALPAIQKDLGMSGSGLLWVMDAYLLTLASLMLTGGAMGDLLGRNKIFSLGLVLFSLASVSCGLSFSTAQLIISRFIQGMGGALLTPGSLSIITTHFDENKSGRAIGLWSMFTSLTSVAGPLLGGWLAESGLWRIIFFINIPLSAFALWIILRKIPETKNPRKGKIDYTGAILITLGLSGLAYGFIESSEKGFGIPLVIVAISAGILALAAFFIYEWRIPDPIMPPKLFGSINFSTSNGLTLFLYGALSGLTFFLPLNLVQVQGYSEWEGGLVFFPVVLLIAFLSPLTGKFTDRFGARWFLAVGPVLTGIGFFLYGRIGLTAGPRDYWHSFLVPSLLVGSGMGITVAPLTTTVMGSVSRSNSGSASGINNSVSRIAGLLAIAILGTLALHQFNNSLGDQIPGLNLTRQQDVAVMKNTSDFAAMSVPQSLSAAQGHKLRQMIHASFIDAFDKVSHISAMAAWFSALLALVFIRKRHK